MKPRQHRGFTLIELLMVLAVIAILVALLMPSLNRAKVMANVAACMVGQRSTGMALHAYGADFRDFPPAFSLPAPDKNGVISATPDTGDPHLLNQHNALGQGHYWLSLLVKDKYSPLENMQCTGIGNRKPNRWEAYHRGCEKGGDGHYFYAGPLTDPHVAWSETPLRVIQADRPQTEWPSIIGYPETESLVRDSNVHLRSSGTRSLAICPSAWGDPPGGTGPYLFEPHGNTMWIEWAIPGAWRNTSNAYYRNCLFTDGHVENRFRPQGRPLPNDGNLGYYRRVTPWMPGERTMFNRTTIAPY